MMGANTFIIVCGTRLSRNISTGDTFVDDDLSQIHFLIVSGNTKINSFDSHEWGCRDKLP